MLPSPQTSMVFQKLRHLGWVACHCRCCLGRYGVPIVEWVSWGKYQCAARLLLAALVGSVGLFLLRIVRRSAQRKPLAKEAFDQ